MMTVPELLDIMFAITLGGIAWFLNYLFSELKRITILLNQTREQYATKLELRDDMNRVMASLNRVEDKLDKILSIGQ